MSCLTIYFLYSNSCNAIYSRYLLLLIAKGRASYSSKFISTIRCVAVHFLTLCGLWWLDDIHLHSTGNWKSRFYFNRKKKDVKNYWIFPVLQLRYTNISKIDSKCSLFNVHSYSANFWKMCVFFFSIYVHTYKRMRQPSTSLTYHNKWQIQLNKMLKIVYNDQHVTTIVSTTFNICTIYIPCSIFRLHDVAIVIVDFENRH